MSDSDDPRRPSSLRPALACLIGAAIPILCGLSCRSMADESAVTDGDDPSDNSDAEETPSDDLVVPFWRLERGQTFSTNTSIRRKTELQVGGDVQSSDETDHVELHYGVSRPDRNGGFRVGMRVASLRREIAGSEDSVNQIEVQPERDLSAMGVTFRVSDGGALGHTLRR